LPNTKNCLYDAQDANNKRVNMNYWLMKSEPETFSIDTLIACPNQTSHWDGVRNYQARNMMRDQMQIGDLVFFYHSNCAPPGIVGIMKVVREGYPDSTALDSSNPHYDPKSTQQNPRWYMVDVQFIRKFKRMITLDELKQNPALSNLALVRRGNRLSILPVSDSEWQAIVAMEQ
jgi:predicted RNA-binding protein with PUA-like domain